MSTEIQEEPQAPWRVTRLALGERFAFAATPLMAATVFLVAFMLQPDARGHGTHEQLGLMPCAAVKVFNTPCPFCGMTTSFSHAAHGDVSASLRTQPGGTFLFVLMLIVAAISLGVAVTGRWVPDLLSDAMVRRYMWTGGIILAAAWVYKIVTF